MAKNEIEIKFKAATSEFDAGIKGINSEITTLNAQLRLNAAQLKGNAGDVSLLTQRQQLLEQELEKSKEKVSLTNEKLEKAKEVYGEGSEEVAKYERQLLAAQTQEQAIQNELDKTVREIETQNEALKQAEEQENAMQDAVQETTSTLEKQGDAFKKVSDATSSFGKGCEKVGKKLSVVSAGIGGIATASVKSATDFETAMAKVNTLAEDTDVKLNGSTKSMQEAILELSNETGKAATDIAESVYSAISAGQSTADSVEFVQTASKLATGGFTSMGNSVDVVTTILNAYEMEASKATVVSDMLINTQNLGKTTVDELSSAMGKVIPTANETNTALDQLCAGYAIMTVNGVATAESTTYMNSMLNELGETGSKVDIVLREQTGQSYAQLMESGYSVADCLQIISDKATEDGFSLSDMFSSSEAAKAGLILLGDSADNFNGIAQSMIDSTGAAEDAFKTMSETTSYKAQVSLNELKNTSIEAGQTILADLAPAIEGASEKVEGFANWFTTLDENEQTQILTIAAVVAAIGPALIVIGKVSQGVSVITGLIGKVNAAIAAHSAATVADTAVTETATVAQTGLNTALLANPIAIVVAAIAGLIAALVIAYNKSEKFRTIVDSIGGTLKDGFLSGLTTVKEGLQSTEKVIGNVMTAAKDTVDEKLNNIKSAYEKNGGGIKGIAAATMEAYKGYYTAGFTFVNKLTGGKLDELNQKASEKIEGFKQKFKDGVEKVKGFFDFKLEWPHIKMPQITVSYDKSGTLAKAAKFLGFEGMPKFNITWNAQGAIFTKPAIAGYYNGAWQGVGEAGPEAVLPIEKLQDYIGNEMEKFVSMMPEIDYDRLGKVLASEVSKQNISIVLHDREVGRAVRREM